MKNACLGPMDNCKCLFKVHTIVIIKDLYQDLYKKVLRSCCSNPQTSF